MATEKEKSDNYLKAKEELKGLFESIQNESLPQIQKKLQDLIASSKGEDKLTLASIMEDYREGNGRSLLHFAASRGDVEIFKYLTSEDCDLNMQDKEGNTPLFTAVQHDNMPLIRYLIEDKKCNITQSRTGGTTILHIACSTGNAFLVQYLIEKGANVDATSEVGTPLQWAISSQRKDIVKILLGNGANPNRISPEQAFMPPPLILAIDTRDNELFDLLLTHGADVNSKDKDGWNPLQFAAEIGDLKLCKILLDKGVDPNYECKGQTALELAFTNNQMEVVSLLRPLTKKSLEGKVVKQNNEQKPAAAQEGPLNPQEAERLKGEGNALFAENKVEEALNKYEEALSHGRQVKEAAPIYSNIALCFLKQSKLQEALMAAQEAKRVDPTWIKGYLREAQVYEALMEYGEAAATYFEALKLDPTNSDLKHNFDKALDKGKAQYAKKSAGK